VCKETCDPDEAGRLRHEVEMLRRAAHPGVVQVGGLEAGADGTTTLPTLDAGGRDLSVAGPLDLRTVVALGAAVATTLADLHDLGLVHGAVQAEHIVVGDDGRPVLCSFGRAGEVPPLHPSADVAGLRAVIAVALPADAPRRVVRILHPSGLAARRQTARDLAAALARAVPDARVPVGVPWLAGDAGEAAPAATGPAKTDPDETEPDEAEPGGAPGAPPPARSREPRPWRRRVLVGSLVVGVLGGVVWVVTWHPSLVPVAHPAGAVTASRSPSPPPKLPPSVTVPSTTGPPAAGRSTTGWPITPPSATAPSATNPAATGPPTTGPSAPVLPPSSARRRARLGARVPRSTPTDACPVVDDGCRPVALRHERFAVGGRRWSVGLPDAVVVVGRWTCGRRSLPAALDRASGQVWVWPRWAGTRPVAARAVGRVAHAASLAVVPGPGRCDRLRVPRVGRPPVTLLLSNARPEGAR